MPNVPERYIEGKQFLFVDMNETEADAFAWSHLDPQRPIDDKVFVFVDMSQQEANAYASAARNRVRVSNEKIIDGICGTIEYEQDAKEAKILQEHRECVDSIKASGLDTRDCQYALGARQGATDRAIAAIRKETVCRKEQETAHLYQNIDHLDW